MANETISCPHCSLQMTYTDELLGQMCFCQGCGGQFFLDPFEDGQELWMRTENVTGSSPIGRTWLAAVLLGGFAVVAIGTTTVYYTSKPTSKDASQPGVTPKHDDTIVIETVAKDPVQPEPKIKPLGYYIVSQANKRLYAIVVTMDTEMLTPSQSEFEKIKRTTSSPTYQKATSPRELLRLDAKKFSLIYGDERRLISDGLFFHEKESGRTMTVGGSFIRPINDEFLTSHPHATLSPVWHIPEQDWRPPIHVQFANGVLLEIPWEQVPMPDSFVRIPKFDVPKINLPKIEIK